MCLARRGVVWCGDVTRWWRLASAASKRARPRTNDNCCRATYKIAGIRRERSRSDGSERVSGWWYDKSLAGKGEPTSEQKPDVDVTRHRTWISKATEYHIRTQYMIHCTQTSLPCNRAAHSRDEPCGSATPVTPSLSMVPSVPLQAYGEFYRPRDATPRFDQDPVGEGNTRELNRGRNIIRWRLKQAGVQTEHGVERTYDVGRHYSRPDTLVLIMS